MRHLGTKTLESERLVLRRFTADDAPAMYSNWANDPEVTKFLTWQPHENVDVSRDILRDWTERYDEDDFYLWAIAFKEKIGEPIGSISVVHRNDSTEMVHIGYCIGKKWWHQGIMTEALALLVAFFFNEVGVNRIESRHNVNNPNSGKVMEKCGLIYEGTHRQADRDNQGICDTASYAILRSDYLSRK